VLKLILDSVLEGRKHVKLRNPFLLGLGLILIIAAAALAKVTTDYDHAADFSKYGTFTWIKQPNTRNPLMKERIVEFINTQMKNKDLKLVPSGGDIGIAAHTATRVEKTLEMFYDGFPGWRWHRGWGGATATVETYEVGTLVVDLFDTSTKQVIWRGVASDTISDNPEKNTKQLQKAVEEMFKHYPPKVKRITD
jgi:hypothetical protein